MKRLWLGLLCGCVVAGLAAYGISRARAYGVPPTNTLTYTGTLLTFGQPDNNTHSISVALFVNGSSSSACGASAAPIQCVNGQFSVTLPAACVTIVHQNPSVNVEVTIDGTVMGQEPLAAVPYALEADTASNVAPGSSLATAFVPQSSTTGAATLPSGTTAERPSSPVNGMMRLNTSTQCVELAFNGAWTNVTCVNVYTATVLVVAGGGGGGSTDTAGCSGGGGGGAGGFVTTTLTITEGNTYSGVVGGGGAGGPDNNANTAVGSDGSNSSFTTAIATGGGGGGSGCPPPTAGMPGLNGGSGGGAGNNSGTGTAGLGMTGQGNNGGGDSGSGANYGAGGGGGAGGVGGTGTVTTGGAGGPGLVFNGVLYAGGGGGSTYNGGTPGTGGTGGGGNGGTGATAPTVGQPNTGGGGGGTGGGNGVFNGAAGGAGIVLVTYPGTQRGTGGTVTYNSSTNTTTHAFTATGSFTYGG